MLLILQYWNGIIFIIIIIVIIIMKFYNRERELEVLKNFWNAKNASLCIIYGRRGIGKTCLLIKFSETVDKVIYIGIPEGEWKIIAESIAQQLSLPKYYVFSRFEELLEYFLTISSKEKVLVIIDEFQRIVDAIPEASSILQQYWDLKLSNSFIKLILCGSSVGMMFKETLSHSAPLYGRTSSVIHLKPFKYLEFRQIFDNLSERDIITLYAIFGGTPSHFKFINPEDRLEENILKILDPSMYLFHEPRLILSQETRSPERYLSILLSIAKGKCSHVEIANEIGIKATSLPQYLKVLEEMDLIARVTPVTEDAWRSKLGRYKIIDPFYRFWAKYVFPFEHMLEIGETDEVLNKVISDLSEIVAPIFEDIVREIVARTGIFGKFLKLGSWWNRRGDEIDIVGFKRNEVWLGEIKWCKIGKEDVLKVKNFPQKLRTKGEIHLFIVSGKDASKTVSNLANELNIKIITLNNIINYIKKIEGKQTI